MEGTLQVSLVFLGAVLFRWCVSLGPYSGKGKPPMYGDYEAQRHWMEVTQNLEIRDWYRNTSDNDLLYWGLDYPPLQAYHSWICGFVANALNPQWVALTTSRGHESYEHQIFMRATVLVTDVFFYFSGVLVFYMWSKSSFFKSREDRISAAVVMLAYPGLMLIDYGHFQYNNFSLGFIIWAIFLISNGNYLLGSVSFVISLNFKQIGLYHAFPIFCHLLGVCVWRKEENRLFRFIKIGTIVLFTFAVCWMPFLSDVDSALQVLRRIFPFNRGIFEDKVANIWCSLSVLVKYRNYVSSESQVLVCLLTTAAGILPSCIDLFRNPTTHKLKCAVVNSSLVFFLCSYHVHEKSILYAAIPVCLLLHEVPLPSFWFLLTSTFSMFPLLIKDGQVTSYFGTMTLFYFLYMIVFGKQSKSVWNLLAVSCNGYLTVLFWCSITGSAVLVCLSLMVKPPSRYPDLWPVLISLYSCGHFVLFLVYFHVLQFSTEADVLPAQKSPRAVRTSQKSGSSKEREYMQVTEEEFFKSTTRKRYTRSKQGKKTQ